MAESIYSVYLVQRHGEQGGKREVTSPVSGHELEFYDTGVWLDREAGRNFFPYEQIRTIREHPEDEREARGESVEREAREEGDEDEARGEGIEAERADAVEGDTGAEEDMLEE